MSGSFVGVLQTHPECWTSAHSLIGSSTGMQQGMQCSAAYQVCNTLTSARPPCRGMQVCNGMQQVCSMQVCNGMQYATVCIPPQPYPAPLTCVSSTLPFTCPRLWSTLLPRFPPDRSPLRRAPLSCSAMRLGTGYDAHVA